MAQFQLPQMRVSFINIPNERKVALFPVKAPLKCENVKLQPVDVNETLLKSPPFISYLQMYLSNAFLIEGNTFTIKYFGQLLSFKVVESLVSKLSTLSFEDNKENEAKIIRVNFAPKVHFHHSTSAVKDESNTKHMAFDKIGGLTKAKNDLSTFLIDPILK